MIERAVKLSIRHKKSGREFTDAQKLQVCYQIERRPLLGARGQLEQACLTLPPSARMHLRDAIRCLGTAEDSLRTEYERDRAALAHHLPESV